MGGSWAKIIDKEFIASFQNYSVGISRTQSPNRTTGDKNIYLKIYDAAGEEIESVDNTGFEDDVTTPGTYEMLSYIYDNARRKALGVDMALDTLLMELGV